MSMQSSTILEKMVTSCSLDRPDLFGPPSVEAGGGSAPMGSSRVASERDQVIRKGFCGRIFFGQNENAQCRIESQ